MDKKGEIELPLIWLIDLILIVILIFFVFDPALDRQAENVQFYKRFSAKNLALYIDAVYTAPYPLKVYYNENTPTFTYVFEEDTVYVLEETEKLRNSVSYKFIPDQNKNFRDRTIEPNNKIEISDLESGKIISNIPIAFISTNNRIYPISVVKTSDIIK
ncbi:hypothetical protein HN789_04590 [archaeon]|jgi:hypothetical protein|nr:hypothetical protein [archaeon]MBT4022452.1 hypothetical protein [archaeon]MBT4272607.1 hypothetical protein [archaeon]MBT4461227.1 hypothetical protein [archaeon]MBT4858259.1 hypothetical protein [archaeon]